MCIIDPVSAEYQPCAGEPPAPLPVDCVLLAAGESIRMGTPKMLLPLEGECLILRTLRTALRTCRRVILVQGAVDLRPVLPDESRLVVVDNRQYRQGQMTSIQAGVRMVWTDPVFLMLGDLPLVDPGTYRLLYREAAAGETVYPVSDGKRGHPVLAGGDAIQALKEARVADRAREVLRRAGAREVRVDDRGIFTDIDTMAEYVEINGVST